MSTEDDPGSSVSSPARGGVALVRLLVVQCLLGIGYSAYLLLPKYLAERAADPATIGSIAAAMSVSIVAATPVSAWLVDAVPRLHLVRGGAVLFVVSSAGFLLVSDAAPAMLGLRILHGLAFSLTWTALSALAVDVVPPQRLGRVLGYLGAAMLASQAAAPALFEPLTTRFGWAALFLGGAVMALVALVATFRMPAFPRRPSVPRAPGAARGPSPLLAVCVATSVATGFSFGAVVAFVPPLALERGSPDISGLFIGYTAAALGVRLLAGGLGDAWGHGRVVLLAVVTYASFLLGFIDLRPGALPFLGAGLGLAHGVLYPSLNALALDECPPHRRGRVQAYFFGSFHLGAALSGATLGVLARVTGIGALFAVAAAISASPLVPLVLALRARSVESQQVAPSTRCLR